MLGDRSKKKGRKTVFGRRLEYSKIGGSGELSLICEAAQKKKLGPTNCYLCLSYG